MKSISLHKQLVLALGALSLAQISTAAIYRPIDCSNTAGTGLVAVVAAANLTTNDDIIDLGGNVIICENPCTTYTPTIPGCTGNNGLDALPPIASTANGGKLSIINGNIVRDVNTPSATPYFRLIETLVGANLTLFNVDIENGNNITLPGRILSNPGILSANCGSIDGGAILNNGTLDLVNVTLYNNIAGGNGGAICNGGTLDIQSSDLNNNTALTTPTPNLVGGGGAIFNDAGATIGSIDNSSIYNNITPGYGAGIDNLGAANQIFDTTIAYNFACETVPGTSCPDLPTGSGGGIYNAAGSTVLQVINCTIYGNTAYEGGGIFNDSDSAVLSILDDIPAGGGVTIYNSTIVKNTAWAGGGGIYNSNNIGDGTTVAVINALVSNIIADNTDNNEESSSIWAPDIQNFCAALPCDGSSTITLAENNLISNNSGVLNISNGASGNIVGTATSPLNPHLKHLEYNGGFTMTVAIEPGSPAKDNGLNPYYLFYDQRGKPYRRVACGQPDIGAYELQNCFADLE